ncbi:MAG: alpha/beta hydrolase [Pseudomonadota bacterium]
MSLVLPALNAWLRLTEKSHLNRIQDVQILRDSFERKARLFFHPPFGTQIRTTHVAGREALTLNQDRCVETSPHLLYFHGGAFICGSPATHRAMIAWLSRAAQMPATLPRYRLAPEHPFPAALDDAIAIYDAFRDRHAHVVIGGDSAGGCLVLSLLGEILRSGRAAPSGVFAFSPLTDLTGSGQSMVANADREAVLPAGRLHEIARMYLAGVDPTDPRASPLFADHGGAPPVWLTVSDTEILFDDCTRLATRMRRVGVDVDLHVEHGLPHVWPLLHTVLPESRATLRRLAAWLTALEAPSAGN